MADPYLDCPASWARGTLEPDHAAGLILRVESGGTPSTGDPDLWDGDVPWLTPKDITARARGYHVSRTERTLTRRGLMSSGAKILAPGTVMLTKRAPVGAVAVNAVPMTTNQGFLNFTCGPRLRPLYLAYWLTANRPYLDLVANGSTYPELYRSDLFEFEIAVPEIPEQDRILAFLGALSLVSLLGEPLSESVACHATVLAIKDQSVRLDRVRDAVLPALLSGRLDLGAVSASR